MTTKVNSFCSCKKNQMQLLQQNKHCLGANTARVLVIEWKARAVCWTNRSPCSWAEVHCVTLRSTDLQTYQSGFFFRNWKNKNPREFFLHNLFWLFRYHSFHKAIGMSLVWKRNLKRPYSLQHEMLTFRVIMRFAKQKWTNTLKVLW